MSTTPDDQAQVPPSRGVPPESGGWAAAPQPPYTPPYAQPYAQPYGGWSVPGPPADPTAAEALRRARTALGWAIGAAVGAGLAMLGMLVAFVLTADSGSGDRELYETLRGEVVGLPEGSPLSADRLERVLVNGLAELGAEETDLTCPDTASVSVSTVVVCTGTVEGYPWTGVVVFEDSEGSFAVVEL